MMDVVQTHIIPTDDCIDDDVLRGMTSLGCFKDKEKLKAELLKPVHNTGTLQIFRAIVWLMAGYGRLRSVRVAHRAIPRKDAGSNPGGDRQTYISSAERLSSFVTQATGGQG